MKGKDKLLLQRGYVMLYTVLKKNSYQDSINLMLLTNAISTTSGVNKVQVMMGTEANKDIFKTAGLLTAEAAADPSDMVIVLDADAQETMDIVLGEINSFLSNLSAKKRAVQVSTAQSWAPGEEEAKVLLEQGDVQFIPCHHVKAVGLMGGN